MKSSVLLSSIFLLVLVGCNNKQVDPHTYQASGCPVYTMPDDFVYTGSPTWSENAYCNSPDCHYFQSSIGVKAFVDTYVAAQADKVPVEICVFIRRVVGESRTRWSPLKGKAVTVGGRDYCEGFGFYDLKKYGINSAIAKHLSDQGYTSTGLGYVIYYATRNVNERTQMTIAYAYNCQFLPDGVLKDEEGFKTFLRTRFAERIASS